MYGIAINSLSLFSYETYSLTNTSKVVRNISEMKPSYHTMKTKNKPKWYFFYGLFASVFPWEGDTGRRESYSQMHNLCLRTQDNTLFTTLKTIHILCGNY